MGASSVTDVTRYKIVAFLGAGKSNREIEKATGVSRTYVNKFRNVFEMTNLEQWDKLIDFSRTYNIPETMLNFAANFTSTIIPDDVRSAILSAPRKQAKPKAEEAAPEEPKAEEPKAEQPASEDNTAAAMVNILTQLNSIYEMLKESADDICQTDVTSRKLLEGKIDNNFDVLCQTIRDGFESVKTTIRKVNKQ